MKFLKILDKYYEWFFIVVFFLTMLAAVSIQVFTRYCLNFTFSWSEELARICFVWITLFGISLGAKNRQHLRVVAFITFMPKNVRRVVEFISVFLTLMVLIVVVYKLTVIMSIQIERKQITAAMRLPAGVMYIAGPLGLSGMIIRVIQHQLIPLIKGTDIYVAKKDTEE